MAARPAGLPARRMSIQYADDRSEPYRVQVLDSEGRVLPNADPPDLDEETLLGIYEGMLLARRLDTRAVSLQRQGRLGTYAPMAGQEAAQVASAMALDAADWLYPTYRDHAAKIVHGMDPASIFASVGGKPAGYVAPEGVNVMPEYIPIATQIPHATGAGMAARYRGEDTAVLCYFGDGATSEGDFHEGLNFAGVFDAPVVFFCNNNQWAISTPVERQTASETIAEKAHAYGFAGVRVDGMDPLAVYQATREALEKARSPGPNEARPTLIEAVQYRYGAHSTADDPSVYRDDVPDRWEERDPLDRYRAYLRRQRHLDDERESDIEDRVDRRIEAAVAEAEAIQPDPAEMFDSVYAEPTPELEDQRADLEALRERYGDVELAGGH